jgi:hypothetical protein
LPDGGGVSFCLIRHAAATSQYLGLLLLLVLLLVRGNGKAWGTGSYLPAWLCKKEEMDVTVASQVLLFAVEERGLGGREGE